MSAPPLPPRRVARLAVLRAPGRPTPAPTAAPDRATRLARRLVRTRIALAARAAERDAAERELAELRAARAALEVREARFRSLIENAFDSISVLSPEGILVYGSPALERVFGHAPQALLGTNGLDLVHPDDRARVGAVLAALAAVPGGHATAEYRALHRDGGVRVVMSVGTNLLHDPAVGGIVVNTRDVSEQRAAEEAGRLSEAQFRAVFDQAGVGITILDDAGRLVAVNPAFAAFVGRDAAELLGGVAAELSPPEDAAITRQPVRDLRAGLVDGVSVEKRFVRPDGAVRWAALTLSRIGLSDGRVGVVGLVQDVTDRKHAEAASARLAAVLELTPDVVVVAAPDGRLQYLNSAGRRLLGIGDALPPESLTVADVQPELVQSGLLETAVHTALTQGAWRGEAMLRKRDGRDLPVDQLLLAHRGPDGAVECLSAVMRDITERRQVEAALRGLALVDELTGLYNRRGFMAMAEHEWRRAQAGGWPVLAFYVDVDEFKAVNDTHGHTEGDRALRDLADILRATFRESDVIGRLGGDEFAVLVPHTHAGTQDAVLARLAERVRAHNAVAQRPYALSISVGVAAAAAATTASLADLVTLADVALYERKRTRRERRATPAGAPAPAPAD